MYIYTQPKSPVVLHRGSGLRSEIAFTDELIFPVLISVVWKTPGAQNSASFLEYPAYKPNKLLRILIYQENGGVRPK